MVDVEIICFDVMITESQVFHQPQKYLLSSYDKWHMAKGALP
jgi:hypothetical protein